MPGRVRGLLLVLALATSLRAQDDIAQLRDPDPNVRLHAAERLGAQRLAEAVPALIDAAYDPSAYVTAAAVDALGRIGPPARQAVPQLEELALAYPGLRDRVNRAVQAIGRPAPTVPALIVWLRKNGMQAQTLEKIQKELADAVLPALSHKNPRVRGQAALVLGRCAPREPKVVTALLAARAHESPYVRGHVFHALRKDGALAAQAFAKDLEHDDVSVRRVAALALKRMGRHAQAAMPALIRAVKDEDIHVRSDAIRAIGEQRAAPKEAVIALTEVLEEGDERLQWTVSYACSLLGRDAAPATLALAVLLEADDPGLRARVCGALANIGPDAAIATPALIQACFDETWGVASEALRALGRIGPGAAAAAPYVAEVAECYPFAAGVAQPVLRVLGAGKPLPPAPKAEELPLLLNRLAGGDPEGAGKAAFAIGRLAPQDAATRDALRAALRHETPYVRRHASFALGRIGRASVPALIDALTRGNTVERRLAADTLLQLAHEIDATAVPVLQRALSDPDIYVRRNACSAIGAMGAPAHAAIPELVKALRDEDLSLARSAAWSLGNMKGVAQGTVGVLAQVLAERADEGLGWEFLRALGEFGAASEPAIPTIKEVARRRRDLYGPALEALVKIGPAGHAVIVEFIREERGPDRGQAIEHVLRSGIRPPGLREALEQAVQDPDQWARRMALEALRRSGLQGPTSVKAIVAALRRETIREIRRSGVWRELATAAKVGELLALLGDADDHVRWAAFAALSLKRPEEFSQAERERARELVRRAFADASPQVRHVAGGLLRRVPPTRVTPDLIRWAGAAGEDGSRQAIAASLATVGAQAVPALIQALRANEAILRRGAAAVIAEMGPVAKAAEPVLVSALASNDEDARLYAKALVGLGKDALAAWVRAYGRVKDKNARTTLGRAMIQQGAAAVPHLEALREKGDADTRRWTGYVLGAIGEPALPSLLSAALDADVSVAQSALSALGRIQGHVPVICSVLARALRRPELRRAAVQALGSKGKAALPWVEQAAVDEDPGMRAAAYSLLPVFRAAGLPLLRRGLDDPDETARAAAVRAAAWPATKALLPLVIRALRDKSERVRCAAASSLGAAKPVPAAALTELLRLFRVGTSSERRAAHTALIALDAAPQVTRFLADPDPALRASATRLLARMGKAALPSLIAMVETHDDPARLAAAGAMARIGAQDELAALLSNENPGVRASAAKGLGEMRRRARGAVPSLIQALDDPEPDVVLQAVGALGEIGPGAEAAVEKLVELGKRKTYRESVTRALRLIRRGK